MGEAKIQNLILQVFTNWIQQWTMGQKLQDVKSDVLVSPSWLYMSFNSKTRKVSKLDFNGNWGGMHYLQACTWSNSFHFFYVVCCVQFYHFFVFHEINLIFWRFDLLVTCWLQIWMNWFGLSLTHGINNKTHISIAKPLKTFFEDCYYYKIVTRNIVTQHELIIYI